MIRYFSSSLLLWTILLATHSHGVDATFSKNLGPHHFLKEHAPFQTSFMEGSHILSREVRSTHVVLQIGVVILQICAAIYLMIALIIVCDKFYIPSIYIISKYLSIPKAAGGSTFMAFGLMVHRFLGDFLLSFSMRGGIALDSLPGFFVFHAIFVTSACAFASRAPISGRTFLGGFIFTITGVGVLSLALLDATIHWYESVALFLVYVAYCAFPKLSKRFCKGESTRQRAPLPLEAIGSSSTPVNDLEGNDSTESDCPYEPISLKWPATFKSRLLYILTLPIVLPLWLSLPDSSTSRGKKFFAWTFIGSIIWISLIYSPFTVWSDAVSLQFNTYHEIPLLVFFRLCYPSLICSVIVARRGFGDMALATAQGMNILEVCVKTNFPWLLSGLILQIKGEPADPLTVFTGRLTCTILLLLMFSITQLPALACFKWRLGIGLGVVMLAVYVVFVIVSILLITGMVDCPL